MENNISQTKFELHKQMLSLITEQLQLINNEAVNVNERVKKLILISTHFQKAIQSVTYSSSDALNIGFSQYFLIIKST